MTVKRHLFFAVLIMAIAMYFFQNSAYAALVRESRLAECAGGELESIPVEPIEYERGGIICRILSGEHRGKLIFVKAEFSNAEIADASCLVIEINPNERQYAKPKNFGFDYDKYLYSRGIEAQFKAKSVTAVSVGFSFAKLRRSIRSFIADRISEYELGGLIGALVLGEKDDFDLYDEMKELGISHLLVISGLHFSIIHGALARATNFFGSRHLRAFIVITGMSLVLFIVKSSYSAERAFFSMLYYEIARLLDRRADILTAQSFALGMILIRTPAAVLNTGLHLSVYTYFAIAFLYRRLTAKHAVPIVEMIKFSLYVQAAGLPITCFLFGKLNLFSAIANMLCVPLFGIIVPFSFVAVIIPGVEPVRAAWLFLDNLLYSMIKISPISTIDLSLMRFDIFIAAMLLISLAFVFGRLYSRKFMIPLVVLACIIPAGHSGVEIVSLDVLHGDCTLVRSGALTCLVDTGDGRTDIASELRNMGIFRLDIVVITHFHNDHYGGLARLMDEVEIGRIYMTELTREYFLKSGGLSFWDRFCFSRVAVVVDSPLRTVISKGEDSALLNMYRLRSESDENDNGICAFVDIAFGRCWFFGDASEECIRGVLGAAPSPEKNCIFLKAPHHGSKTSSSGEIFKAIAPLWISVSHSRKYNLPSDDFVRAVSDLNVHSTYYGGCMRLFVTAHGAETSAYLCGD